MLLIAHEATRTGAPRIAVEIGRGLRASGSRVRLVLRWDGPLRPDLAAAVSHVTLEPLRRTRAALRKTVPRVADRFEEAVALFVLAWFRPRLVYANTVKAACYVRPAIWLGIPVVLHVHELEPLASTTLARYHLGASYERIALVGCSAAVCENLARVTDVPVQRMVLVPSMVDVEAIASRTVPSPAREDADDLLTIGACARADRRKGVDLWLEMVAVLLADVTMPKVRFVWVGSCDSWATDRAAELDLVQHVEFVGEVADVVPALGDIDIFTLPSREDPFPLVVLEAMAAGKPVVAFRVGGVADQLGEAGVLVEPGDPVAMATAVAQLVGDPSARSQLGDRARRRVRECYSIERFHTLVVDLVEQVLDVARASSTVIEFEPAPHRHREAISVFMLKYFDAARFMQGRGPDRRLLPYGADAIVAADVRLRLSDASMRPPWTSRLVRTTLGVVERRTTPFLQAWANRKEIAAADAVIAVFESHANGIAAFRRLGWSQFRKPRLVVICCWLAEDIKRFSTRKRLLYRVLYRQVDLVLCFSSNQVSPLASELSLPPSRVRAIPFGVGLPAELALDARPVGDEDAGYVLAVGRDRGRDWRTLFDAAARSDHPFVVACRLEEIGHLDVPGNVQCVGFVPRERYLELTRNARLVVVATRALAYPTGQSVALEAMAMGKCCIVTDTEPMRDYLQHEENALLVPVGDTRALDAMIDRAWSDADLRRRIGERARESVGREFTEAIMWARIGAAVREVVGASPSDTPDVTQCAGV